MLGPSTRTKGLGNPWFPLKGSFKGDIDVDTDVEVDVDIDSYFWVAVKEF